LAQLVAGDSFKLRKIVVMTFPGEANGHLPQRPNAIGIAAIVVRAYFMTAGPIVHDFLLVSQITEIGTHHRPKLFIRRAARILARLNTRKRKKTDNQKS
jgi:hypothetical protein